MPRSKYKKQKDGRFYAKVWDGTYLPDGKRHNVMLVSSKSSKDLELKVLEFKKNILDRVCLFSSNSLFTDYSTKWLEVYKPSIEINTRAMYLRVINVYFPFLDGIKLSEIRRIHFQSLINENIEHPRTCQQISLTFKQIIQSAISDKLLPPNTFFDVCHKIALPKYVPGEKRGLTIKEKSALSSAPFTSKEQAFIYLAFGCGLRRGEILALTAFDIDLKSNSLTINKAICFDGNTPCIKAPKSQNGYRTVPMPAFLSSFLSTYLKSLKNSYLFTTQKGELMTKSSYRKMWENIFNKINSTLGGTKSLKVTDLTPHVFRHNYCSNLCYQIPQISIKKIAQLLGDSEKMVIEVYNHVLEEREDVSGALSEAIHL
ncbi:MAG TPA: tyrosine-type recombinase/integrase [Lachnospiraceae bacterium]